MRPKALLALLGLLAVTALALAGCGGSSSPPTPTEAVHVTTAKQVAAMRKRLAEDEELRPLYKAEAEECKAVTEEYEWGKECTEPLTEKLARLTVLDEILANELMHMAGEGCRKALEAGAYYDRIEAKTIAGCKADIGKQPASGQ